MIGSREWSASIRRNYGPATPVRLGPPLLARRSTPNRAWRRDVSRGLGHMSRATASPSVGGYPTAVSEKPLLRRRSQLWKERLRSLVAELEALRRFRPRRAFN